jgi:regulator of nucleoside diphosphate kinase
MKKAASIFLRAEIEPRDVELLIHWMENPHITQYLNEEPSVIRSLQQLLLTVPAPMLTFHFNRWGRFFLVCRSNGDTIGFVKLRELPERGAYEIVYVIGEETLWGHGYGESAICSALAMVFGEWRGRKVIAKIYPENQRSIRSVCACGFRRSSADGSMLLYSITMDEYLQQLRDRTVL